jgi:hypothetical protein
MPRMSSGHSSFRPQSLGSDLIHHSGRTTIVEVPVRGALDEKHAVYSKAVALEEGLDDDDGDLESNLVPRPVVRVHSIKIGIAIMLVILTQCLGISRVSALIFIPGDCYRTNS